MDGWIRKGIGWMNARLLARSPTRATNACTHRGYPIKTKDVLDDRIRAKISVVVSERTSELGFLVG